MTITPWELYWILKLDSIHTMFFVVAISSFITALIVCFYWINNTLNEINENDKKLSIILGRFTIILMLIMFISAICAIFIPTTAQMAVIKVVPMLTNTEFVQKELPDEAAELYGMLKQYLRKSINNDTDKI